MLRMTGRSEPSLRERGPRTRRRLAAVFAVALALGAAGVSPATAEAARPAATASGDLDPVSSYQVEIGLGKSQVLETPGPYTDLMIADPKIADVVPVSKHSVYVVGKGLGSTALTIYGPGRRLVAAVNIVVGPDSDAFKTRLNEILPDEKDVSVHGAGQSLIVSGTVSSPANLAQILALADTYDPGKVVNMLSVEGTQQVMLSVRFVEMERTVAKDLKLNLNGSLKPGGTGFLGNVLTGDSIVNSASSSPLSSLGTLSLLFKSSRYGSLEVLFDALETRGLIKTLAEPSLVTMSGDTASFLAGGEFPVPVPQQSGTGSNTNTITIIFKQFGISLAFTPTILSDGMINMVVAPEVSSIDPSTSFTENGITVPGLKVRRAHSTVELRDGESFTIAGLLADNYQNAIRQMPFVGDIPILGQLFHSNSFQRDQDELVIVVTPHLVVARRGPVALPTDHFVPPSDFELFLFGMQTGKPDDVAPQDRVLMSQDPTKGGVEGPYGHVVY